MCPALSRLPSHAYVYYVYKEDYWEVLHLKGGEDRYGRETKAEAKAKAQTDQVISVNTGEAVPGAKSEERPCALPPR